MKKKIFLTVFVLIIFLLDFFIIYNYIFVKYRNKFTLEKNDISIAQELSNSPYKINKIILYSSAYGENKNTNFQSSNWILDIFQYTDIAIYIDSKEPIKTLKISNPKFNKPSQKLYYLDANKFGTESILKNFEINENLDFTVLNSDNNKELIQYNTPVFFADSSNPITLKYVNNVLTNYSIPNSEKLIFNGTLFTKTKISLNDLKTSFSFDIMVTNYRNETYSNTLNINIPIENDTNSILNGNFYLEHNNLNISLLKQK